MKPIYHVHMTRELDDHNQIWLNERLDDAVRITTGDQVPSPAHYRILVAGRPPRKFIEAAPRLEAVIIPWAGVPEVTLQVLEDHPGISLHNLHHNALPTAEMAVGLLVTAAKQILPFDSRLRNHDWRPRYQPSQTWLLEGKTALILGYGAIGEHIGRMLVGLGMRVMATRRSPRQSPVNGVDIFPAGQFRDLLPRADVLVISLPLTGETEGLIGEDELALLKRGAILINIARGPIVDQWALFKALKTGQLYAAGLDVWYHYPDREEDRSNTPPADVPFHELENVVMSPHRGGSTRESEKLRMIHLARLLNAAARGEDIPNLVDRVQGY